MPEHEITRKVTRGDGYNHYLSTNIVGCQVQTDPKPELPGKAYIRFSDQHTLLQDRDGLPATTHLFRITPEAYKRVTKGCASSSSKMLRNKLIGQPRYNFIMVTEKMKNEAGKEEEVVCNVHAYPNSNFRDADFTSDRRHPLDEEDALVQFHENGNIDVLAFPNQFSIGLQEFINTLETKDKIGTDLEFTIPGADGKVRVAVNYIYGTTVTFSCVQE